MLQLGEKFLGKIFSQNILRLAVDRKCPPCFGAICNPHWLGDVPLFPRFHYFIANEKSLLQNKFGRKRVDDQVIIKVVGRGVSSFQVSCPSFGCLSQNTFIIIVLVLLLELLFWCFSCCNKLRYQFCRFLDYPVLSLQVNVDMMWIRYCEFSTSVY